MVTGRGNYPNISSWTRQRSNKSVWSSQARKPVIYGDLDFANRDMWVDWYFDVVAGFNTFTHTGSGGITFAGDAVVQKVKQPVATGGITLAGAATVIKRKVQVVSGGITFAGDGLVSKRKAVSPTGGILLEGSALVRKVKAFVGVADIVFDGTAPKDFIPGAPAGGGGSSRIGHKWHRNQN